jgi:hypothetical protein
MKTHVPKGVFIFAPKSSGSRSADLASFCHTYQEFANQTNHH